MTKFRRPGVITEILEPPSYRVRTDDGREVVARLSRHHFGNCASDFEELEALEVGSTVTVRFDPETDTQAWLVRVVTTQEQWLACNEPATLLETAGDTATPRMLRRFASACCRGLGDLIPPGPHRCLIEVLEDYAENRAGAEQLAEAVRVGADEAAHMADLAHDAEDDPVRGRELSSIARAIFAVRIAAHVSPKGEDLEIALDCARACADALGMQAAAKAAAANFEFPGESPPSGTSIDESEALALETATALQADLVREIFASPFGV